MLNRVVLMGRLTADPNRTITHTGNGDIPKAVFTLAVEDDFKGSTGRITHFIRCSCWRRTADFASAHFHKGDLVAISGRLNTWVDVKDGDKRTVTEVAVDNIYFTGSKSRAEDSQEVPIEYDDQDLPWD